MLILNRHKNWKLVDIYTDGYTPYGETLKSRECLITTAITGFLFVYLFGSQTADKCDYVCSFFTERVVGDVDGGLENAQISFEVIKLIY